MAFKIKNPYPTNRKGKINKNSEGNTDLKDGRSKSSAFQKQKELSKQAKNLLKVVPNKEAYDKLSKEDKEGFDLAAKEYGLPHKKHKKA